MIEHSQEIGKVMAAIRAVQRDVDHVTKGEVNPHFGNTYTDLNTFLHALREPLAEHGLTMTQAPGMEGGNVTLDTLLYHESGEWIRCRAASPLQKQDPQAVGSGTTYLRRYSIASLFAIPQEDDDGNAASGNGQRDHGADRPPRSIPPKSKRPPQPAGDAPECPQCSGPLWDNREDAQSSMNGGKRPDWKCKDKECDWAFWVESAREKLTTALERLLTGGTIDGEAMQRCLNSVDDGNLHAFRIAQDWVNSKEAEAQGREPAGV